MSTLKVLVKPFTAWVWVILYIVLLLAALIITFSKKDISLKQEMLNNLRTLASTIQENIFYLYFIHLKQGKTNST